MNQAADQVFQQASAQLAAIAQQLRARAGQAIALTGAGVEAANQSGAQALADYELLAILLRTGSKGSNVLEFSRELLRVRGGLVGLFNSRAADLQAVRGLGKAKTSEILAVTELARRFMREEMLQPSWSL